ncbi:MAG: DsrE family protein [Nitrospiraceae bacterium]|nr:DsrE family protein [Nitrospiraceae bacterium]
MQKLKAIIHVNETVRWDIALANITNLLKDIGDDAAHIMLLANGPAVEAYADSSKVAVMQELNAKGVRFLACRNSLNKLCSSGTACIREDSLPAFIEVVPAGITAIITSQNNGYAYIKP